VNHLPSESPIEWEERSLRWEGEGFDRNVNGHNSEPIICPWNVLRWPFGVGIVPFDPRWCKVRRVQVFDGRWWSLLIFFAQSPHHEMMDELSWRRGRGLQLSPVCAPHTIILGTISPGLKIERGLQSRRFYSVCTRWWKGCSYLHQYGC